jgi:PAS domain S-box-containing protein
MLQAWVPPVVALAYGGFLFGVAYLGDKRLSREKRTALPAVYSLALGVYCSSWTFFGAVGRAASNGWDYLSIYLGPILVFALLHSIPRRIIAVSKRQRVTSIADFISSRYGKSHRLAVVAAMVALVAVLPYIALQLRAVSRSYGVLAGASNVDVLPSVAQDGAILVAAVLAVFTILFGTRQVDVTESQRGMVLAIAVESAVKLLAFVAVGLYVVFGMFEGPQDIIAQARGDDRISQLYASSTIGVPFLAHTLLAMLAIICLPRQFHVAVVENSGRKDLATARWAFPIYLAIFSMFVVPIAVAGILRGGGEADFFVLTLPLAQGQQGLALLAFVGGFSAATGMVIVATIACSTMLCNEVVIPAALKLRKGRLPEGEALGRLLIWVRRLLVVMILTLAWGVYRLIGTYGALATIGLLSFVAAAQFAPSLLGGLYWRRATAEGALAGLVAGFAMWVYTLLVPVFAATGWLPADIVQYGPFGISWLRPEHLFGLSGLEPVTHGTLWSLGMNTAVLVGVSFLNSPGLLERRQAAAFAGVHAPDEPGSGAPLRGSATVGDVRILVERFVGRRRAAEAFRKHFAASGIQPDDADRCSRATLEFTERLLAGTVGAAAARTVLASALRGGELQLEDVASIVEEASHASRFNRDLLESTLENVYEGISVIDAELRLVAWNRRYAELFRYPDDLLRAGTPVESLIRYNARLGRCGRGDVEELVARRMEHMRGADAHVFQRIWDNGLVLEIRQNPLPGGGFVTSFSDITEHKRIETALRESERNIRVYTDNVPVLIAYVDRDLRFRFVNKAYEEALGVQRHRVVGRHVEQVLDPERFEARKSRMNAALAGVRQVFEVELSYKDRGRRVAEATYLPEFDGDGQVRGFFALFHDITETRRAERALKESHDTLEQRVTDRTRELSEVNKRLKREIEIRRGVEQALREAKAEAEEANMGKTRFLAAASHDLLQPLNAARLFTSALVQRDHSEQTLKAVDRIDSSLRAAEDLLTTLLDISKLDAGALEPKVAEFGAGELLDGLATEFGALAREQGLDLRTVPCSAALRSDRRFLRRILQNLLSNALRYTASGRVLLGCRRRNGFIRIEVWDTGPGIPEDKQSEIFEEFKRLQVKDQRGEKGLGLGLAIVKRMGQALGHRVEVRSIPGRGSVFSVDVPRAQKMRRPIRSPSGRARIPAALDGVLVLCVDNQPSILEGMAQLLSGWGCEVLTAVGTRDALETVDERSRCPDVLLVDYHLDDGDNGLSTMAAMKERYGDIPGVVITADHGDDVRSAARSMGYTVLRKPVKPAALRAIISQYTVRSAEGA